MNLNLSELYCSGNMKDDYDDARYNNQKVRWITTPELADLIERRKKLNRDAALDKRMDIEEEWRRAPWN